MRRGGWAIRWLLPALLLLGTAALGGWAWWSRSARHADPLMDGRAAYDRGDWSGAERQARARLKAAVDDPEGLRLLARAVARLGRDSMATVLYGRLGAPKLEAEDLYLLGICLGRSGRDQAALQVLESARDADRTHAETLFELTRRYNRSDRLTDATRVGKELAACPGWESRAEALLGAIQLERNDPAGATDYWRRALERPRPVVRPEGVPSPIVPRAGFASALLRAGRPDEARDQLRFALADGPDPEAYWLLSRADLQRKDWAAARADLERSGSFRLDNPMRPEPAPYVGAASCAACHSAQFEVQQASRHARTFARESEIADLPLPGSTVPDPSDPSVRHALHRDADGRIRQETNVAGQVWDAVVQYAFGSGDRGLTLVGRNAAGRAYELRLSEYPEAHGDGSAVKPSPQWDVTAGHPRKPSHAEEYLGQPLTDDAVRRCLTCHVTDPQSIVDRSGPCAKDRAIGCELCHGPGGNHLLAVEGKLADRDLAIARPTLASGERIVKLCAGCHSPRGREVLRDDPASARFQATTLTWSRCYTESDDQLDCITCHDPHRNASTSLAHYEARCLECHSQAAGKVAAPPRRSRPHVLRDGATRTTCPVNPSTGCIGCHMPAVEGIVPHSTFTDHFIRVHRD